MNNFSIKEFLLAEFDREMVTTRKMLERVPFEKFDWTPHAKSTPLGRLANHVATMPRLVPNIVNVDKFEMVRTGPLAAKSTAEIVAAFEAMFMDHLIHHRAQLGVYLRLNDVAIPGSYGPSADEPLG